MFCSGYGAYGFGGSLGSGWIFFMGFRLLIFIALIIIGVKLFKSYTNRSNSSFKILDELFAKGEISEEEYLKRKSAISKKN